jgi:hypothetical protein
MISFFMPGQREAVPLKRVRSFVERDQGATTMNDTNQQHPSGPDGRLLLDYNQAGATRCYVDCPATGYRREVAAIEYCDGGRLVFPIDFSSQGDAKQYSEAFPQGATSPSEEAD